MLCGHRDVVVSIQIYSLLDWWSIPQSYNCAIFILGLHDQSLDRLRIWEEYAVFKRD